MTPHLYVHYEDRAVSHLLAVAAGLDSMVVGEDQILGQVRSAIKLAAEHGTACWVLGPVGQLCAAHRQARPETGIGRAGVSLLSAAVELAATSLRPGSARAPMRSRDATSSSSGPAISP